jgi:hypothetical protein
MLVGRWGIMWRPLRGTLQKASRIIVACMKLHNFIASNGSIAIPDVYEEDNFGHSEAPDHAVYAQDEVNTDDGQHRRPRLGDLGIMRCMY